jgi:GTP-binding protein HflX
MTNPKKIALLISLTDNISEIELLADSMDYSVLKKFIQRRSNPDVKYFVGFGKVEEIKDFIKDCDKKIDVIIVNGELKPSQWFNLEKKLDVQVFDRIRLILSIFGDRAERKEAKLQVKLAELRYERPYVRELIHRARAGEHPGLMAGGEYQVDDYYEMIKKQIKKIKKDLEKIRAERALRRRHRHHSGFYLVSIAGYTNAGKSSLLNLLADEQIKVEGRLFSTLSTTTRRIEYKKLPILLTDTVGFIQNLPAWVIDAFHSTLEEIEVADVILLVVDSSEKMDTIVSKIKVSIKELNELGVNSSVILVLNKIDILDSSEIDKISIIIEHMDLGLVKKIIPISIKNNQNIDNLIQVLYELLPNIVSFKIKLPINESSQTLLSWIYDRANVKNIYYDKYINLTIECSLNMKNQILSKCEDLLDNIVD